jgi:hypothetical protein
MPAYVILFHELPDGGERGSHWDIMLEDGDCLRTWAVEAEPSAGARLAAIMLPDHRLEYLDYEGPVSADRGHVSQWDRGSYQGTLSLSSASKLQLESTRWRGCLRLQPDGQDDGRWWLTFPDAVG